MDPLEKLEANDKMKSFGNYFLQNALNEFFKNRWPDALPQTREESQDERGNGEGKGKEDEKGKEKGCDSVLGPPPKDPSSKWFEASRMILREHQSNQAILRERAQTIMEQWRTGNKDRNAKQQRTD